MTFKEFMQENGYDLITTFWEDFSIADKYGIAGVKDTYKRAFSEWKDGWRPYCMMCNRSDRMVSEPYGFKCPQCGNMIGFNLKRLKESPLNNASKEVI